LKKISRKHIRKTHDRVLCLITYLALFINFILKFIIVNGIFKIIVEKIGLRIQSSDFWLKYPEYYLPKKNFQEKSTIEHQ
jgi:hypothetical protein